MPNQSGKIAFILILLLLSLGIVSYYFYSGFKQKDKNESTSLFALPASTQNKDRLQEDISQHISNDLKVSFYYPKDWVIDDRYLEVLVANFKTNLNSNNIPAEDQIEVIIHNARGCHKTIDENLVDPSCGKISKNNEILVKETEEFDEGIKFYKYLIKYPSGKEQTFYFLEKGDRVLQIDKNPDPSQFENEFIQIIKSIRFT